MFHSGHHKSEACVRLRPDGRVDTEVGTKLFRASLLGAVAILCAAPTREVGQLWGDETLVAPHEQPTDQVDAAQLRAVFRNPPPNYRPLIIMHSGALQKPDLLSWLATRRAGGVVLDAGVKPGTKDLGDEPWNNPTYLDDRRPIHEVARNGESL